MHRRKIFLLIIVLVEWFALIAQLVVHLQAVPQPLAESLIRFFSFFTILTNTLVAVYSTVLLLAPSGKQNGFFLSASVQTAITLYIVVVGLVYNILLRSLWDSSGLQAVLYDLLHTLAPLLALIYWWVWVDARKLTSGHISAWLIYPAVYAIAVMLRGHTPAWYPYPFLDAGKLGYTRVLINSAGLVVVFLLFAFLFIYAGKRKHRLFKIRFGDGTPQIIGEIAF